MGKRYAILDHEGLVLNVVAFESPPTKLIWPGYGAHYVYADEGERPPPPAEIDPRVTYLGVKAQGRVGPRDRVNLTTGIVTPNVPPTPPPPTKDELRAHAAERRWQVETGGCPWGEYVVATDRDSQSKLIATIVAMQIGTRADPSGWKMAHGEFVSITNAQVMEIITTAHAHIAAAFDVEENVIASIASGGITTFEQIDNASWPSNGDEA